jgi:NAD(P)-dependent dehydrogenase (short-subunit alcohol dehydrogenase family)
MSCTQHHALVTGASTGIGRATALRLAAAGWHVYAGVRRTGDGESLQRAADPGATITPLLIDVTDADQIDAGIATITDHVGASGLDGLVNNAGIGVSCPTEVIPLDTLRFQFEVNVFGQVAVTQAALPLLRRAGGRIVIIGSIGDRFTPPFGGPLTSSKAAIASLSDALRQELAPWNIRVVLIEPASIQTDAIDKLQRDAQTTVDGFSPEATELYRDTYLGMVNAALAQEQHGSAPDVVGDVVLKALTTSRPPARYLVGKHAHLLANLVRFLPTRALDAVRRKVFHLPAPGSRASVLVH